MDVLFFGGGDVKSNIHHHQHIVTPAKAGAGLCLSFRAVPVTPNRKLVPFPLCLPKTWSTNVKEASLELEQFVI
jgi:hypothetical protein